MEWKTPKRTRWQCTASVCVAVVLCWVSPWGKQIHYMERDSVSVLSLYPRIFLSVLYAYLLLEMSYHVYIFSLCFCVLIVLVLLSVLACE